MFRFSNGTIFRDLNLHFTHIYNIINSWHILKVKDVKCGFSFMIPNTVNGDSKRVPNLCISL
jgi:hypothetical protein